MVVVFAGGDCLGVDEQGDVGFERADLLVAAGDELPERFGSEAVAIVRTIQELRSTG